VVVAIDGPGGVGKSTVGRAVATALGIPYLDTGGFYRAVTLAAVRAGTALDDYPAVLQIAAQANLDFEDGKMLLDGSDVSADIRKPEVTAVVSLVAAIPDVRSVVVKRQQEWVQRRGGRAVVEGRDIGTVVFPGASVKVFLTAETSERARRRARDIETAGQTVEAIAAQLASRDRRDSTRKASPLRAAPDATIIDTSRLPAGEVIDRILRLVEKAGA
jgi:cytidylate kinase